MKEGEVWGRKDKGWGGGRADDPSVRQVHAPTARGPGDGLTFFILFGLKRHRDIDQQMVQRELEALQDDIAALRGHGFQVVVDPQATRQELLDAVTGKAEGLPAAIYWSAHGHPDGGVEACDGDKILPEAIPTAEVVPELTLFVMSACYSAARASTWRAALGGRPLVVGWGRPVTIERAVDFLTPSDGTETDLDDLIRRYLVEGQPLPPPLGAVDDQPAWKRGESARLEPLIKPLAEALLADWREKDGVYELRVRTEGRRLQVVRVSVVESDQPLSEGHALLAAESEVGELTKVLDPVELLRHGAAPGYSRVCLVQGPADLPVILVQGFHPLQRATLHELAGVIQEVALRADRLEHRIFGGDFG